MATMAQDVGLNPHPDIHWVLLQPAESIQRLAAGQIEALVGFPPLPQEIRAKKIGHLMVNRARDRPWSQDFCCVAMGNRALVRQHPIATKRALRALLKGADLCAREPDRAARVIIEQGCTPHDDDARQAMQELPDNRWREYDPEDAGRFYARRLQEAGFIKSTPQTIIAQGTDWRFVNELQRELKG